MEEVSHTSQYDKKKRDAEVARAEKAYALMMERDTVKRIEGMAL